jgi:uncharacterized protein YjbJ (UPF0337 family)
MSHIWFDRLPGRVAKFPRSSKKQMTRELKRMGTHDKVSNKIDDVAGKAKEAVGRATGDDDTRAEGKLDQAKSSLKDAGEKVKDAFKK